MSLTSEQVQELTNRINERFAEFNVGDMCVFEPVTPGVARHGKTWAELAEYAKLKLKGTRGKGIGR